MPEFHVSRSLRMDHPPEVVFGLIRDFRRWAEWSPWLICDPTAKLDFHADGRGYGWDGEISGAGKIEVVTDSPPDSMDCRLTFLKPWKAVNRSAFRLTRDGGGTTVEWSMTGSLPWFLFWMKGTMSAWIGADFDRGLKMIRDLAETGAVPSKLSFPGIRDVGGFRYIGVKSTTRIEDIAASMGSDMTRLTLWLSESGATPAGKPLAITHCWNPAKGEAEYTLAYPVGPEVAVPEGFVTGEIPSCRAYLVEHTGAYRHLGNAWAAGMMHARSKRFPEARGLPKWEVYENDPTVTAEADLLTRLHFPVK